MTRGASTMEDARSKTIVVRNNETAGRFEADVAGQLAVAEYVLGPTTITFTHTRVPDALAGRGIASQLVEAGLAMARTRNLRVIPRCSFVAAYMRKHPGFQDLLAKEA
jgi:uncharacterized protein